MKKFPIALQVYSVRDDLEKDFYGTLKKVKELGYDGVEFAGLYGNAPADIRAWCAELELVPISAHVPFVDMMENPDLLADYAAIGCKYVAIPYLTEEYRPGAEKFDEVIAGAKVLGEKAKALGMQLLYHNHDFEFLKVDGKYALDILYDTVPADLLATELDTCWVNVGGEDPAGYVRKYSGRAPLVHLKDFVGSKAENMYALIGIDNGGATADAKAFEFRPVGYGKQDWYGILNASEDAGAEWVVVEQDQPSIDRTPLQCAELSVNYLRTLI
ncbi:MAG: sugar phosphate isomerase/epimerase [Oscillospiraceae bacterium]|nr:sugar phosphate isomerase/epimerase [Oscillospiraceae bacterium]